MVYGVEAVLPSDIEYDSPHVHEYDEEATKNARQNDIDAKEESRLIALERMVVYQQKLWQYQGQRIRSREFNVGDLVLRLKQKLPKNKISSPWAGTYIIHKALNDGAYRLHHRKTRRVMPRTWNAAQLRLFYA